MIQHRILLGIALVPLLAAAASSVARSEEQVETRSQAVEPQAGDPSLPPLTPEELLLASIQQEGQQRVAEVLQAMQGEAPGPAIEALQAQIVQIKKDTYVRFLTARAELARTKGDEAAALEAERIIEQLLHPQVPAEPAAAQSPEKPAAQEGGQR